MSVKAKIFFPLQIVLNQTKNAFSLLNLAFLDSAGQLMDTYNLYTSTKPWTKLGQIFRRMINYNLKEQWYFVTKIVLTVRKELF